MTTSTTAARPVVRHDARELAVLPGLLVLAGLLFAIYPVVRPYAPGGGDDTAAQFASPWWLVAHLAAVAGFIALVAALVGLGRVLAGSHGGRIAGAGAATAGLGVGLTLPYYGSEALALHAIGVESTSGASPALSPAAVLELAERIRMNGTAVTIFGAGLLLLGIGVVLVAVGFARSRPARWWAAVPMALGFALFIPQFWAPAWVRIGHGLLITLGCLLLAGVLRAGARRSAG